MGPEIDQVKEFEEIIDLPTTDKIDAAA